MHRMSGSKSGKSFTITTASFIHVASIRRGHFRFVRCLLSLLRWSLGFLWRFVVVVIPRGRNHGHIDGIVARWDRRDAQRLVQNLDGGPAATTRTK